MNNMIAPLELKEVSVEKQNYIAHNKIHILISELDWYVMTGSERCPISKAPTRIFFQITRFIFRQNISFSQTKCMTVLQKIIK